MKKLAEPVKTLKIAGRIYSTARSAVEAVVDELDHRQMIQKRYPHGESEVAHHRYYERHAGFRQRARRRVTPIMERFFDETVKSVKRTTRLVRRDEQGLFVKMHGHAVRPQINHSTEEHPEYLRRRDPGDFMQGDRVEIRFASGFYVLEPRDRARQRYWQMQERIVEPPSANIDKE